MSSSKKTFYLFMNKNINKENIMKFAKIRDVKSPNRGTPQSAGIDFFIPNDWNGGEPLDLQPGGNILIPSGIKVNVPTGYALIAFNKSGVAAKKGLIVGACVIDEDYQGEVHLNVINTNHEWETHRDGVYYKDSGFVKIVPGEKLLQCILVPVNYANPEEVVVEELYAEESLRGSGGFGSTGVE
jgi:dUTP pyrophosphatase